jgi:hypothetical protein
MEAVLAAGRDLSEREVTEHRVEVHYRADVQPEQLGAGELEVLGSHLQELVRELLEIIYDNNNAE